MQNTDELNSPQAESGHVAEREKNEAKSAKPLNKRDGLSNSKSQQKSEAPALLTKVSSLFDGKLFSKSSSLDPDILEKLAPTKTCLQTLKAKQKTIQAYPSLAIEQYSLKDYARNLILQNANSVKAEVVDMVTMNMIMQENSRQLTHAAVDRFFDWLSLFALYLERYFYVEEDVMIAWIIAKTGLLRGEMKASARTLRRGRIQKLLIDIVNTHAEFPPSLPAGERIGRLTARVEDFAKLIIDYFDVMLRELPDQVNRYYSRAQIQKMRRKWVNYVMSHVGSEDFLVLHTRWMKAKDLRDWKTKILLLSEFKYFAYKLWHSDMQSAHFQIVATFTETLQAEVKGDTVTNDEQVAEFVKLRSTARPNADELHDDEEGYDEEEGAPMGAEAGNLNYSPGMKP